MLSYLFWSLMEQGGSKIAQLVVQLVLARILAPEVFGVLAILLVFTTIADSVAQSGMGTALIQREGASSSDYSTAFWLSLTVALVMYAALFLSAPLIEGFYGMDGLVAPLRVISLTFVFNSFNSIQRSYLQKRMDFKGLCKANVLALVLSGALGVLAALAGLGIWALVVQYVSQAALACVALLCFSPWRPSLFFDVGAARELYSYGWKICVTGILGTVYTSVSELILGKMCSATDLGLYSQGRKWPNSAILLFTNAIQNVFLPAFSELQSDAEAFKAAMRRMLVDGSFVVVPVSCLATVASGPIVNILLGIAWEDCVPVFGLTCLTNVVLLLQVTNLRAYMALGRSDLYLALQVVKVLVGGAATAAVAVLTRDITLVALANAMASFFNVIVIDLWPAASVHGYARGQQLGDIAPIVGFSLIASVLALFPLLAGLPDFATLLLQATVFGTAYLMFASIFKLEGLSDIRSVMRRLARRG